MAQILKEGYTMSISEKLDAYREDFELFESAQEKLEYIFDLGKRHKTLAPEEKNEESFIEGCASPAWLVAECRDGRVIFRGEGSSEMAKGMMTLLLDIFGDADADEILSFDPARLHELGIVELLSPVRQKSLEAFMQKVYEYAKKCKEAR
jgi:cysteine desulfuration protein SufE